jgi:hypothetical protein
VGAGAGIGIAGVVLILTLIVAIVWYSRRRRRQRTQHQIPKAKAEAEAKPQLEDTSAAWKDNIHTYKPELSAVQEVHELDTKTARVLPPELRAGLYSNRHEMEASSEKFLT